jgi:tetratricopeptide (TPR) repeat protein
MDRTERLLDMLRQQPADAFLQHALALEYIKQGAEDKAEAAFRALLTANPGYVGSYYHLASLLVKNGQRVEALNVCETGLAACRKVGDDHAWRELNMIYEDLLY